ncbi:ChbG/HpnK family deacetylase [Proteiniborus sp. MB09-C3]|uniref:carbohydrate deacetylase n=1 Tax=Proteiniborus sp. MB09-C3 TaxID=3050072 RepID=UPI0025568E94|nr:ChbG/HpnK family deacetylase [Proteiniborus sp. MB09-C3]WIV12075.1 ChbG/HpnK family deacetylase [Proteiniborus sp. MB09-C3]
MKLIVNADDFGISEIINKAIAQAFEENLASSATIMTNMPGFENACELINEYNLNGKIGIHLNLVDGYPLTERMTQCHKFCDDNGMFNGERKTIFYLNREERGAVYEEFQAQIDKLMSRGVIPTHIDSHHHYHTEWAIFRETIRIAHKNEISSVRLTRNCGNGIKGLKKLYKIIYNSVLRANRLSDIRYFGSAEDVMTISKPELYSIEIMVHPAFDKDGNLLDLSTGEKLQSLIEDIKAFTSKINIVSYL